MAEATQAPILKSEQKNLPSPKTLPNLRAAYSDRTSALMAFLAAFAYHPSIDAAFPDRANNGAGVAQRPKAGSQDFRPNQVGSKEIASIPGDLAQLGFTSLSVFSNGMTDGFAFVAESPDLVVLSFRGTQSQKNWNTNFRAFLVHPENTNAKLRVHQGFYQAFKELADAGLEEKIAAVERVTGRPLYITGHSLGGALAQIAAAVFGSDTIAACYTFGSPRVGNFIFDLWVKPPSYRVINHADLVPQVPLPIGYRHSGDPRYLPKRVEDSPFRYQPSPLDRCRQLGEGILQFLRTWSILGIKDHAIAEYYAKLEEIAAARTQDRAAFQMKRAGQSPAPAARANSSHSR
jgi:hypothetical protein